ncbi:heat shock factor binding protein 1 [Rhinolophus ferrumequinum]|uniref:Heat shock factor-binding protein 1 n=1 Tax=Rhinolophus ferrumequinum TaxID=59479 RepID=A0A7J7SIL2_RHIFE|nr:heat shock factor binding protein 1 [Rhinolophus ferrumequinum]
MAETEPKTMQDLTSVVQTLLQQMQDKFQTMSDQIIGRNILCMCRQALTVLWKLFSGLEWKNWKVKTRYQLHKRVEGC